MASGAYNVGSVVAEIKADITGFKDGMAKAKDSISGFGTNIDAASEKLTQMIKIGAAGAVAMAGFIGKKALDEAAQYEQQVIALTTLLGDTKKAEEQIALIRADALKTPFNVEGLITANQLLISAGVGAKQAEQDILNLGDAISANGKGAVELDRIVVNLQQIKNVGKATEMDMKQFAFNGINMYKLLADSTGLSIDKLKDMDISYEMISQALAKASAEGGIYHEANFRQSESLTGLKSNLADTAQQQLVNIANQSGLTQAAKDTTTALTTYINDTSPIIIEEMRKLGENIKIVVDFMAEHKTAIEVVGGLLLAFFTPAIIATGVQAGISATVGMAKLISSTIQYGIEGWKVVAMIIAKIAQFVIATAAVIAHTAVTIAQTVATGALTAATWLLNAALAVLTSPIFLVIAAIAAIIAIGYLLIKNWDQVKAAGEWLLNFLRDKWEGFVGILKSIGQKILDAIMWPFNEAKRKIEEVVNFIKDRLDFTQRHSPSVMDILNKSVRLANDALSDLDLNTNITTRNNQPVLPTGNFAGVGYGGVTVNLDGAIIANDAAAMDIAETIGDQIIKKLNLNIRS